MVWKVSPELIELSFGNEREILLLNIFCKREIRCKKDLELNQEKLSLGFEFMGVNKTMILL